ncbi:hypothetical protein PC115_g12885 [Phytophthora cactorum]|uniref:Uncharacterized protein n=1 Tax=Phytophthora cactorum TaxID=29920 RepID=A0A8T1BX34_9STRA|nr:hypothetical protein PC115_g12885 [Phytophthora cactorum]KAG3008512.1 hypothetical protein PC120_g16190 [Phytophthora cactorum]
MEHEVCTASGDDIEASASAGSSYYSAEEDDEIVEIDEAVTEHIDTVGLHEDDQGLPTHELSYSAGDVFGVLGG